MQIYNKKQNCDRIATELSLIFSVLFKIKVFYLYRNNLTLLV